MHNTKQLRIETEKQVFEYNILGLDNNFEVNENLRNEMNEAIKEFDRFVDDIKCKKKLNTKKYLYGALEKDDAYAILKKYPTVDEGFKHIPGRPSEKEDQESIRIIIDNIINKLYKLKDLGERTKIYKKDFFKIKMMLLEVLFGLFGSAEDLGYGGYLAVSNFDYTISKLEQMEMIPKGLSENIKKYLCGVSRWY